DARGDVADRIKFRGLTARCTIRIYSYSGQLVQTIEHDGSFGEAYFQISRNNQLIASGVYYFVVEDESGARTNGKFVIIH
ncbi:T9SS type A sorting domain-containing protein, partial [Sphingobacteriales bacterium CHB3]|nr:T9SS type A sorting domain-containing protein [Sphingobacteriales bacterium CHB3]